MQYVGKYEPQGNLSEDGNEHDQEIVAQAVEKDGIGKDIVIIFHSNEFRCPVSRPFGKTQRNAVDDREHDHQ